MPASDINELIKILQISISPVALISGVGLLVLSLTNRFAHTIDRARILSKEMRSVTLEDERRSTAQLRILFRRTQLLLIAVCLALASVFFSSLLIAALFVIYALGANFTAAVALLFVLSLGCLVSSIIIFMYDMSLSLRAFKEELADRI